MKYTTIITALLPTLALTSPLTIKIIANDANNVGVQASGRCQEGNIYCGRSLLDQLHGI